MSNTSKTKSETPEPTLKEEGERFGITIPPKLWTRVEKVMAKTFLGKTAIVCQALDLFVTMENEKH